MVNFDRVRDEIQGSEPERATGIAIAALAQTVQNLVLMDALPLEERESIARKHFGIPKPEQADTCESKGPFQRP